MIGTQYKVCVLNCFLCKTAVANTEISLKGELSLCSLREEKYLGHL